MYLKLLVSIFILSACGQKNEQESDTQSQTPSQLNSVNKQKSEGICIRNGREYPADWVIGDYICSGEKRRWVKIGSSEENPEIDKNGVCIRNGREYPAGWVIGDYICSGEERRWIRL